MPDGAVTLRGYPGDTVRVQCDKCGREGAYQRERVAERVGWDAGLPDVLRELADCDRWTGASDPCGAHYAELR